MASDSVFATHLTWARNITSAGAARDDAQAQAALDNAQAQAVLAWNALSAPNKAAFRRQIEHRNEAWALMVEARIYLRSQHNDQDYGWNSKWVPILQKEATDPTLQIMTDLEITQLNAFRLVLDSYIFAMQVLHMTLVNLLPTYTQFGMQNMFNGPLNAELAQVVAAVGPGAQTNLLWIKRVCALPRFRTRLAAANLVWVAAVGFDQDSGKALDKLWLMLAFDNQGRVQDRYVRKREYLPGPQWFMPMYWWGQIGQIPMEFALQELCRARNQSGFVGHRRPNIDPANSLIEYKIEYCPNGTLHDLYRAYVKLGRPIPEPLLWMAFQKMVEQCLIMEQGAIANPDNGWLQIVHRDIKPGNVFLDVPSNNFFPQYPTPKMADFGYAFRTFPGDITNPDLRVDWGTPTYLAPEQHTPTIRGPPGAGPIMAISKYDLDSRTNVWGIGMIMLQLTQNVALDVQKENTLFLDSNNNWTVDSHTTSAYANATYSQSLILLINRCIGPYPDTRPTAQNLYTWITGNAPGVMGAAPPPVGPYCAAAASGSQPAGGQFEWPRDRESYKLWAAQDPDLRIP